MENECDIRDIDVSDYTILVKNIAKSFKCPNDDYDLDLKNFLESHLIIGRKLNIVNVNFTYNLTEF